MTDFNRCFGCMRETDPCAACPKCGFDPNAPVDAIYLKPGSVLHGKYVVGRCLGHGGFGITYLAWDRDLMVKAAIKEYLPTPLATRSVDTDEAAPFTGNKGKHFTQGLTRFLEEARALARFQGHPGIVAVRDYFTENQTAYYVMEFMEGLTLKQFLKQRGGKLPFETIFKLLMPVLDTLREVHAQGLLHRDVSPDNIYITTKGQVKMLDFGAARQAMGEENKTLSVILKPGFAPEEQYRSKGRQGPWTDVYGVAATMYKMLTGATPPDALDRMKQDDLVRPSARGNPLPAKAEEILLKGLAVDASNRFQTMREFQQGLMAAHSGAGVQGEPVPSLKGQEPYEPTRPIQEQPPSSPEQRNPKVRRSPRLKSHSEPSSTFALDHDNPDTSARASFPRVLAWIVIAAFFLSLLLLLVYVAGDLLFESLAS